MRKAVMMIGLMLVGALALPGVLYAQSSSSNYSLEEQFNGAAGSVEDGGSSNYSQRDAAGDAAVGESNLSNDLCTANSEAVQSGYVSDGDPRLIFIVDTSSVNFSTLSTSTAKTANATFSVLNYTSYGYVVQTFGDPPSSGSHILTGMSTTDASQNGVEQFGINLRANTSPVTFGADPQQVPSSGCFSYGGAAGGYSTANQFRYVPGETIASASQSSGQTDYTVSYIVNISSVTPGGVYTGEQGFIAVATY